MQTQHPRAAEITAAVRDCIGTRFRAQGRLPSVGLDCVGVVLVAAQAAGVRICQVPPYQMGGDHEADITSVIARMGFIPRRVAAAGDVLLFAPADGRRHLAVLTDPKRHGLIVHAHAGVGRVVESPFDPDLGLISIWRFPEGS